MLLLSLVVLVILVACVPVDSQGREIDINNFYRNEQTGPFWNPLIVGPDYGYSVELPWHPINPPHPGLTCWAAEIREKSAGYAGYGYSYVYCEPSS